MKPPPFVAERPGTLDEALRLLANGGDGTSVIAGGQSLYPLLALRFARPETLVDLTAVRDPELRELAGTATAVRIGALLPHVTLRRDPLLAGPQWRALRDASRHIGHYPIQVRGTIGGSLAHADPSAELCALALLFDAEMKVASATGGRTVAAARWFDGPFQTALRAGEILTQVTFRAPLGARSFFAEAAPRPGDFALASAAVLVAPTGGSGLEARVVVGGAAAGAVRCGPAERLLAAGGDINPEAVGAAAAEQLAASQDDPVKAHIARGLVAKLARQVLQQR